MEKKYQSAKKFFDSRKWKRIIVSLTKSEFEKIAIETIKKETGVDLTDRLYCDYDEDTLFVRTIIDVDSLTDEEFEKLAWFFPDEWYESTNRVLVKFFNSTIDGLCIYAEESCEPDFTCYVYMPYDLKLQ